MQLIANPLNLTMQRKTLLTFGIFTFLILAGCNLFGGEKPLRISGQTMGTTYNVIAIGSTDKMGVAELEAAIEAVLADVNSKMSNWDKNSEISRFNTSTKISPVEISQDLTSVLARANDVHRKSGGKFDVTLGPLIDLWGFGPRKPEDPLPSDEEISKARLQVEQASLLVLEKSTNTLTKKLPGVTINLSAIAKGFGIDAVANRLTELGFENYMVEIGGDLRTSGHNPKGDAWRVGIEKPEPGLKEVKRIVAVSNLGMATSGDYRNFVEADGVRYSHIIDPTTGRPITHRTTSVSVLAKDAMTADAWATALLVLGREEGMKIADKNNIAAYFISRNRDVNGPQYVVDSNTAFEKLAKAQ